MGNAEEKSDDAVDTKVDDATEILPVEENLSTVNIGPFEISPIEENMNTFDICPYEMPIESYGEDVTVAINSCSLLKCTGQTDDQGRDDKWVDCVSDTKCSSIVSSPIEENVCTVNTSFSEVAANIAVEEPVFLQPCQLFDAVDNCSLKIPDMPDFSVAFNSLECSEQIYNVGRNDSRVDFGSEIECPGIVPLSMEENLCTLNTKSLEFATESADNCSSKRQDVPDLSRDDVAVAINSSNSLKCSRQTYNEGTCDIQVDCGSETKCPAIVPSFSRRSSRAQKPIQKSRTKNIAGKCRKTANVPYPDSSTEIILNGSRKKRSCVSKPARSSMWGLPGNVNHIFEKNIKLGFIGVQSQELQKVKASRGNGKTNKVNASGNSKGSRKSPRALTTCIRLKVKAGKEVVLSSLNVMIPAVVDTSGPANGTTDACGTESILGAKPEDSNLINGIGNKMGNVGTGHYNVGDSSVDCEGGHGEYRDEDPVFTVKGTDSFVTLEKSVRVTAGKYLGVSSADSGGGVNTDLGTSPDSEVINSLQDAEDGSRCQEDLHDSVLTSKDFSALGDVNCKTGSCIQEDGSPVQEGINCAITLNKSESRQKLGDDSDSRESLTSLTIADASTISSSSKEFSTEMLPLSTETEVGVSRHALKVESDREDKACCILDAGLELPESMDSKILLPSTKIKGRKFPKCSKSGGGSKGRSKDSDSAKSRIGNMSRKRENRKKSVNKKEVKQGGTEEAVCNVEGPLETGSNMGIGLGITNTNDNIESVSASYLDIVSGGLGEQTLPPRKAWVCCDDCHKWRRIPASLVDSIGENSKWTCKDNMDKSFADCSISQEKSNAEINAELELSEASGEEDASNSRLHYKELECRPSKGPQPASFTCIPSNEFLHRSRKSQTIDEIMVCHCKPPLDGRMGCGDECLNRMLNIECVRGTCPCGDLCSNQQFQKREYAGMRWFPTGKKGYGLQLLENVSKGQFLIEYVGEVLDMHAYEGRQKQYASDGHKHFYFMTLNGSEVIDASAKGNMGRFINHSCDPNCRTEKWMVNGEICIGLFALKNMKKGEEVTFDYNFVRVFGAAAKKCYCGSLHCQGYIGGDPSNTEIIVQGDSDEEFPEPVMLFENRKSKVRLKNKISKTKRTQKEESVLKARNKMDESTTAAGQSQITSEIDDSTNISASGVTQLHSTSLKKVSSSAQEEISAQTDVTSSSMSSVQEELSIEDDPLRKAPSSIQSLDESTVNLSKLLPNGIDDYKKSKSETHEKRVSSKLAHRLKTSRSSSSVKKGKINSDSQNVNKPQVMVDKNQLQSTKPKKLVEGSANGHFETVEVKLNELLDVDGGISKRKDAPKGYLKLLLLTAASGDSGNGEAIQSNRELSMILDALLKTKSRIVLIDIISKNGLQMLHNIMKQYRRDFKKIPILRKLLKVLEYLAVREILTQEHINGGPPCPGMESFKESILSLTEHDDKQVHQIARSFRDKWIPRQIRKLGYGDRADGREFHRGPNYNRFSASPNVWQDQGVRPTEAIDCVKQAMPTTVPVGSGAQEGCSAQCIGGSLSTGTKTRKRKSRWDQPADGFLDSICHPYKEQKTDSRLLQQCESSLLAQTGDVVSREEKSCHPNNRQLDETCTSDGEQSNIHDDVPPGFSSPLKHPMVPSSGSSSASIDVPQMKLQCLKCPEAVVGRSQGRFISRKPVSYGIPVDILRQFGTSQAENVESWITAPGIPFYPFPPLPPCSRNKKGSDPQLSHAVGADPMSIDQHAAEEKLDPSSPAAPNTQAANQLNVDIPGAKNQHSLKRARGTPDLGKRYFRQQKWNNSKVPPWLWKRNGWGFGNNSRNGTCSAGVGNVENEFRNINSPEGINCRVEKAGNNCYPHPQHQNHH